MRRKRFTNLNNVQNKKTWDHFVRWQKARRTAAKDYSFVISKSNQTDIEFLHGNRTQPTITWIGHATFFIQAGGVNIVTDPVWANRMAMHRRLTLPGISIMEMPEIEVVLISHSHYDHLHFNSIRGLRGNPNYLVPEGLGSKFLRKGFKRVEEFKWWDHKLINQVKLSFVPAQHWSKRTPWDTNTSHWGGWIIEDLVQEKTIYFMGDSGYFPGFKEIGKQFRIDHALIPIGAYEPEWFMGRQHVSPEEAIRAFLDVQGETFIPMHFSTFKLADDTPWEALIRLQAEWKRRELDKNRLKILKLGEILHM